jgi:hypothetical protein
VLIARGPLDGVILDLRVVALFFDMEVEFNGHEFDMRLDNLQ